MLLQTLSGTAARKCFRFFFFNDTATTEIYTLSLHDALPICQVTLQARTVGGREHEAAMLRRPRSEEHTSELQSRSDLVCRLLLEQKQQRSGRRARRVRGCGVWEARRWACGP